MLWNACHIAEQKSLNYAFKRFVNDGAGKSEWLIRTAKMEFKEILKTGCITSIAPLAQFTLSEEEAYWATVARDYHQNSRFIICYKSL